MRVKITLLQTIYAHLDALALSNDYISGLNYRITGLFGLFRNVTPAGFSNTFCACDHFWLLLKKKKDFELHRSFIFFFQIVVFFIFFHSCCCYCRFFFNFFCFFHRLFYSRVRDCRLPRLPLYYGMCKRQYWHNNNVNNRKLAQKKNNKTTTI